MTQALLEACKAGDAGRVAELLDQGASAQPADLSNETAPWWEKQAAQLRQQLIEDGLATDQAETAARRAYPPPPGPFSFQIPLFCAIDAGSAECVRLLLAAGADPNQRDSLSHTPLMAAREGEIIQTLLNAGAEIDAHDTLQRDALQHYICASLDAGDDRPARDQTQKMAAIETLLAAGTQINCLLNHGWSRLYNAAWDGNAEAVELLLELGAELSFGKPPLAAACWHWNDEHHPNLERVIDLLVAAGADVHVRDGMGDGLLHAAVMPYSHATDEERDWCSSSDGANYTALRTLLKHGANPNAVGWHGRTPLMLATFDGAVDCVRLLLQAGADPTLANEDGYTALDYAAVQVRKARTAIAEEAETNPSVGEDEPDEWDATRLRNAEACYALIEQALSNSTDFQENR